MVFTLLWLIGCGAWALLNWHNGISFRYALTDPNGLKFVITAPAGTNKADILPFARNSDVVKKWQADCSKERSVACKEEIPLQMPGVIENVVQLLALAISVPFLVFCIGLVCTWVVLGFRKPMVPKS
ncbi:MAG TPA: hypothetical protein VKG24_09940 [Pseudolabrys sp.]|nr:hypothetical protein [Pseudolabrys sp.]